MERQSIAAVANNLIKTAKYLDENSLYEEADRVLSFIKIAQNATQSLLSDIPGGFFLGNLNNTAYGLKSGIGGYPGSGHSYWDNKGGETARQVDLRNTMMGQGGMSAQDRYQFELAQWQKNQSDPAYQAWSKGQEAQMQRDLEMMKSRLQNPSLSPDDRAAIQQTISTYQDAINAIKRERVRKPEFINYQQQY